MATDDSAYFEQRRADGVTIITFPGPQLPPGARDPLYDLAESLANSPAPRRVLLNLINIKTIDSATIGVLINVHKRIVHARGALTLCALDPFVLNVLQLTRIDQVLDIRATEQEAIAAFKGEDNEKSQGKDQRTPQDRGSWFAQVFGARPHDAEDR